LLLAQFPGLNGFLGTRASLMLDVVFLAMFLVVPALLVSVFLVKFRRNYAVHKSLQIALGIALLVAVVAFEVDMRLTGWRERALPSPFWESWVFPSLYLHLSFAIPTALLWIYVIVDALRNFPNPVAPSKYSDTHAFWAWLATVGMLGTAITGWIFYYLAFAAM
jgi:hypothetical protein